MEFLILIAVFGLMMWMMSRGARKQRAAAADLRASLEVGQQVMTASGFYGTIVDIDGDVITLESTPGVETMWKREAVTAVTEPPFAVEDDEVTGDGLTDVAVPDDASTLTGSAGATVATDVEQPADRAPADREKGTPQGGATIDDAGSGQSGTTINGAGTGQSGATIDDVGAGRPTGDDEPDERRA